MEPLQGLGDLAVAGITLHPFPASHYNEKARWALDLKAVPHDRVSLLPGPPA